MSVLSLVPPRSRTAGPLKQPYSLARRAGVFLLAGHRREAAHDRAIGDVGQQCGDWSAAAVVAQKEAWWLEQRVAVGGAQGAAHAGVDGGQQDVHERGA